MVDLTEQDRGSTAEELRAQSAEWRRKAKKRWSKILGHTSHYLFLAEHNDSLADYMDEHEVLMKEFTKNTNQRAVELEAECIVHSEVTRVYGEQLEEATQNLSETLRRLEKSLGFDEE